MAGSQASQQENQVILAYNDISVFVFPPVVSIETIDDVENNIKKIPFNGKSILTFDLSRVETLTTPGIQLIMAVEKMLAAGGGELKLTGCRDAALRAFEAAGFAGAFSKMTATEAANG